MLFPWNSHHKFKTRIYEQCYLSSLVTTITPFHPITLFIHKSALGATNCGGDLCHSITGLGSFGITKSYSNSGKSFIAFSKELFLRSHSWWLYFWRKIQRPPEVAFWSKKPKAAFHEAMPNTNSNNHQWMIISISSWKLNSKSKRKQKWNTTSEIKTHKPLSKLPGQLLGSWHIPGQGQ